MAKLKATPKNYAEALQALNGKQSMRLGNNTYLLAINERVYSAGHITEERITIAVKLHDTDIVKFYADGRVTLHTGGYRTVTTKERINRFIAGRVYQKNHEWFVVVLQNGSYTWDSPLEFEEGFTFYASGGVKERLEYLRDELRAERISYGELSELQGLSEYIDPSDTELLEAAGVPERS